MTTSVEITDRRPCSGGAAHGDAGPYEQVSGVLRFEVDPQHVANASITDLRLAPRGPARRVAFSADVVVLRPTDPARGSGRTLLEAVNRGRALTPHLLHDVPYSQLGTAEVPVGTGWAFRRGWSLALLGWQSDVRRAPGVLGLQAPEAEVDGRPLEGRTTVELRPDRPADALLLANRAHSPRPVVDVDEPTARMTVRRWEGDARVELPRDSWSFADVVDGQPVPSRLHVRVAGGFVPGLQYHVTFTTRGAPVVGCGLLALREAAVLLRSDGAVPLLGAPARHVLGFGMSQSGRLLRHYLHLGLNLDEGGRQAYDGLLVHVAGGRRGEFNSRFAQPSVQQAPGFGHLPPHADEPEVVGGAQVDGLLSEQRRRGGVPVTICTDSAAEYWRGDGSLAHARADGSDADPAPETRSYLMSGTQHYPGSWPPSDVDEHDGSRGRYPFGAIDYRPLLRAALVNLDAWATGGTLPPPSRHPRVADGTAVARADVLSRLEGLRRGLVLPDPDHLPVVRELDLGDRQHEGVGGYPVVEGPARSCAVSAVDDDGNEVAGVALPDVAVPLATALGWNLRHPQSGGDEQILNMQGSTLLLPRTPQEQAATGDRRTPVSTRYSGRGDFLGRVSAHVQGLVADRYLLADEAAAVVAAAAARWDDLAAQGQAAG